MIDWLMNRYQRRVTMSCKLSEPYWASPPEPAAPPVCRLSIMHEKGQIHIDMPHSQYLVGLLALFFCACSNTHL